MAIFPSMFVRRLVLIGGVVVLAMAAPAVRLGQLTLVRGEALALEADKKLVSERWLPTSRGRILDRNGKVLAMDRPSYDVTVEYEVLTGDWAKAAALRKARSVYRPKWGELTSAERAELAKQFQLPFDQAVEAMWARLAAAEGMRVSDVTDRRDDIVQEVNAAIQLVDEQRRKKEAELKRGRELAESGGENGENGDGEEPGAGAAPAPAAVANPNAPRTKRSKLKEETIAHVVLSNVNDAVAFELSSLSRPEGMTTREADEAALAGRVLPGLSVVDGRNREYPLETMDVIVERTSFPLPLKTEAPVEVRVRGVATHLLGWMRGRIYKEDIERRPRERRGADGEVIVDRGHYRPGDSVGAAGLEGVCEDELRGLRGFKRTRLDTGELDRDELSTPGKDVQLTIDISLQARIQALFDPKVGLAVVQPWHKRHDGMAEGTALTGAAVVIDVDSGDVLAMVSEPSFTREQLKRDPDSVLGASVEMPRLNRAISKPYQPGSIVKPLMLCGAMTDGSYRADQRIACTGHFLPNDPTILRCWIYKQFNGQTHSGQLERDLDGADGIMVSCNIFFFELGKRLGPAGLVKWYEKFGVGPASRYWDLTTFVRATERAPAKDEENERSVWQIGGPKGPTASEAVQMAIGQGPIVWTPMHAADAYATIARGGVKIRPHVRKDLPASSVKMENLGIDPRAIEMSLDGLRNGVEQERGTAHHLTYEMPSSGGEIKSVREPVFTVIQRGRLAVWAKTGTADASAVVAKDDKGNVTDVRDGDHSWTVALVGEKGAGGEARPRYAVAVVVDFAGSGGRVAGPIANHVIEALVAEGYLKDEGPGAGSPGSGTTKKGGNGG